MTCNCAPVAMQGIGRLFSRGLRGTNQAWPFGDPNFRGLGDNYSATDPSQCGPGEVFIQDVGCVTRGAPGQSGSDSGSSVWNFLTGGSTTPPGSAQSAPANNPGGANWFSSFIGAAAQVGAAAVTGQNPFMPQPSKGSTGGIGTGTLLLLGGGAVVLLLTRRRSAAQ